MANSGLKAYLNLEEYFLDNGAPTGVVVPNVPSNPNYIPPVMDLIFCPLPPSPSKTPSITPTVTKTTTPTKTPSKTPTPTRPSSTPTRTPSVTVSPTRTVTPTLTPTRSANSSSIPINIISINTQIVSTCNGSAIQPRLLYSITLNKPSICRTVYSIQVIYRRADLTLLPALTFVGTIEPGQTQDIFNLNCNNGNSAVNLPTGAVAINSVCLSFYTAEFASGNGCVSGNVYVPENSPSFPGGYALQCSSFPYPSLSPTRTPTKTVTPTKTPTKTVTPTVTPTVSVTQTPSVTPTVTPSVTPTTP